MKRFIYAYIYMCVDLFAGEMHIFSFFFFFCGGPPRKRGARRMRILPSMANQTQRAATTQPKKEKKRDGSGVAPQAASRGPAEQ